LEKEKVILQNRRMAPVLVQMIERYADSTEPSPSEGARL
jgi:hypothetical protein